MNLSLDDQTDIFEFLDDGFDNNIVCHTDDCENVATHRITLPCGCPDGFLWCDEHTQKFIENRWMYNNVPWWCPDCGVYGAGLNECKVEPLA